MKFRRAVGVGLLVVAVAAAPALAAPRPALSLASVSTNGVVGDSYSQTPVISADGKYVAFNSGATNLVPGDTNGEADVFVRDLTRGLTRRVNIDTAGEQAGGSAYVAGISETGRYVVFSSNADNLVPDDTNADDDAFVRDMRYGITIRVSLSADGGQISGSFANGISGDGRYVVFTSSCRCVVPGDDNHESDVFVRDLRKGTTRMVSIASDGTQGDGFSQSAAISADGRYVAFTSFATNLVPGDTNGTSDVFRHDLKTGATVRISVGPGGRQTTGSGPGDPGYFPFGSTFPSVSQNGRHVAFFSFADGLVDGPHAPNDVYVRDVKAGTTTLASRGLDGAAANNSRSYQPFIQPSISGDGRYVGFVSWASNLVTGDTNDWGDGFVRDLKKDVTRRVTVGPAGQQGNFPSHELAIDEDGDTAAFATIADNFLPGDTNGRPDILVARLKK